MGDDHNGRQPQWKITLMGDNLNRRQPQWETTRMEDEPMEDDPIVSQWKMLRLVGNFRTNKVGSSLLDF